MRTPERTLAIFDFDGTLADTWRDIASALNRTLDEAGLARVEGPDVRFWIGDGALKLLERAVPPAWKPRLPELFASFRVHYEHCCLDTTEPYPGIAQCLRDLSETELAVASNKPGVFLDRVIEGLELKRHFRVVLGGDALDVRKPDPAVIRHVVDRLERPVDEVWMIGDSAVDIETGRAAGVRTIGCAWGLRGRAELEQAGPDHVVERPDQLAPIILG